MIFRAFKYRSNGPCFPLAAMWLPVSTIHIVVIVVYMYMYVHWYSTNLCDPYHLTGHMLCVCGLSEYLDIPLSFHTSIQLTALCIILAALQVSGQTQDKMFGIIMLPKGQHIHTFDLKRNCFWHAISRGQKIAYSIPRCPPHCLQFL